MLAPHTDRWCHRRARRARHVRHSRENGVPYGRSSVSGNRADGPGFQTLKIDRRERRFLGYAARGVPYGPDDGTIDPCAVLASLPFTPELSLSALRHFCALYPEMIQDSRLPSSFNPTLSGDGPSPEKIGLKLLGSLESWIISG